MVVLENLEREIFYRIGKYAGINPLRLNMNFSYEENDKLPVMNDWAIWLDRQ